MFKLLTEKNTSGNIVFKKKREGNYFIYFAENKLGQIGEVNKEWIEEYKDQIINANIDKNGVLYLVDKTKGNKDVDADKKISMTLSTDGNGNFTLSNLKLYGICMIKSNGITNIHESLEIKDNRIKLLLDEPLHRINPEGYRSNSIEIENAAKEHDIFLDEKWLYIKESWLNLDGGKYLMESFNNSIYPNNYSKRGFKVYTSKKFPLRIKYHIFSTTSITDTYDGGTQDSIAGILQEICKKYDWKVGGLKFNCKTYHDYSKGVQKLLEGVPVLLAKQEEVGEYIKKFNAKKLEENFDKLGIKSLRSDKLKEIREQMAELSAKELGLLALKKKYLD